MSDPYGEFLEFDPSQRNHEAPVSRVRGLFASIRQALAAQPYVLGVDLSHYNVTVDFKALKAAGYEYVILKATEANYYTDPTFAPRWRAAVDAGLIVGAYHFFRSNVDGVAQAVYHLGAIDAFWNAVQGRAIPSANDVETEDATSISVRTNRINCWHNRMRVEYGIDTLCYSSQALWQSLTNNMALKCWGWAAHWTSAASPLWPIGWQTDMRRFWQFGVYPKHSWVPPVPGVTGEVDVNRFFGTLADLQAFIGQSKPSWGQQVTSSLRSLGMQIDDPPPGI